MIMVDVLEKLQGAFTLVHTLQWQAPLQVRSHYVEAFLSDLEDNMLHSSDAELHQSLSL